MRQAMGKLGFACAIIGLAAGGCSQWNGRQSRQRADAPDYASIGDSAETAWYARQERQNRNNMTETSTQKRTWKPGDVEWVGAGQRDSETQSPDARILAFLHRKNMEEIDLGRLAERKSESRDVKSYGVMMVRDHSEADSKVNKVAADLHLRLRNPAEESAGQLPPRREDEQGRTMSSPEQNAGDERMSMNNPGAHATMNELQSLDGSSFDRAFAQKMVEGHQQVIQRVEAAQGQVQSQQVRQLLNELLPTLRMHEQHARDLESRVGGGGTSSYGTNTQRPDSTAPRDR